MARRTHPRVVAAQIGDQLGAPVLGQRAVLQRGVDHSQHRRVRPVAHHPSEPVEDTQRPCFVAHERSRCEQDQRTGVRTRRRHLQGDVGAQAVPDDGGAPEVGGRLRHVPGGLLHAHVVGSGRASVARQRHRDEAATVASAGCAISSRYWRAVHMPPGRSSTVRSASAGPDPTRSQLVHAPVARRRSFHATTVRSGRWHVMRRSPHSVGSGAASVAQGAEDLLRRDELASAGVLAPVIDSTCSRWRL